MANNFYDHVSAPAQGAPLSSAVIRAELDAIEQGFDKLPALTGNGLKKIRVNAAGTALEAVADTTTAANVINTPAGSIAATDVQAAINELDSEKIATSAIGVTVQAYSANLDEYAAVNPTAAGLALLDDANAAAQRATLGLVIGTDVQAYDADTAKLDTDQNWSGSQRSSATTDNDLSFALLSANNFVSTPTGAGTLTFTDIGSSSGQSGYIKLVNGSNYAISLHANTKMTSSDLTKISATGTYLVSYFCDGTNVLCTASGNLA